MSGTEWDDEDPGYPSAPVPPHERAWRHPSELSHHAVVPRPSFSRGYYIGAGVVGVALVAGLIQLLQPRSGSSVLATQATQVTQGLSARTAPPTTVPVTEVTTRLTVSSSAAATTSEPIQTTTVAVTRVPATNAVSTVMLLASKRGAVPIGDGYRAVTTAGSLSPDDTIDVQLSDGTSAEATVVSVDASANVAVIELERPAEGAPPSVSGDTPHDGDLVYVGCTNPTDGVLVATDDGMLVDMESPPAEGAPVLTEDGDLVGLTSTTTDGLVHLVPISDAMLTDDTADDEPLIVDVWLGITFEGDDLVIDQLQVGAPAHMAGAIPGDLLLGLDDAPMASIDELWTALAGYHPGDLVTLIVERGGEQYALLVTLGARPS